MASGLDGFWRHHADHHNENIHAAVRTKVGGSVDADAGARVVHNVESTCVPIHALLSVPMRSAIDVQFLLLISAPMQDTTRAAMCTIMCVLMRAPTRAL